jgi:hypothetical protein
MGRFFFLGAVLLQGVDPEPPSLRNADEPST